MFSKRMKHAHRYQEIIRALLRNGFGYMVKDLGLTEAFSPIIKKIRKSQTSYRRTLGERIRIVLEELGPTFIKFGQVMSTRRDLFPEHIIHELEKLQDHVPPFSFSDVNDIIQTELGGTVDGIFAEFCENPIASASIGQVHFAVLHTGEQVAVKVQRPNITKIVNTDLEIIKDLLQLAKSKLEWTKKYPITELLDEFSSSLREELNFTIEGRNAEKIGKQFKSSAIVHTPAIFWNYSTERLLTMEFLDGIKINDLKRMEELGYNRKKVAEKFANSILQQMLEYGFFHGDPHPGNILILPGEKIGLLDFGMVGKLSTEMKYQFVSLVISLKRGNNDSIIKVLSQMGILPDDITLPTIRFDIEKMRDKYYDIPLSQVSFGEIIHDFFQIAQRHQIQIPAELTILGKSLMTLEGIVEFLDPSCNIMGLAEPFAEQLAKERFHPKNLAENAWHHLNDYAELLSTFPKSMKELSTAIRKGKLRFEISTPELHMILKKMDQISNRLSLSIVLLAFSILMVGLIVGSSISRQSTILWKIPAIEIGFVVAGLMFFWLIISIFRSGKF
ncbi:ABC1 kinase family protein [Niallia sp. 03190]|uniref:ABC1 kinase family protein n=1 Tax=Niallia sp. 03190 TaxID=3458061 RepID=UPI004044949A